ncbi:unnamed protein product [Dicrocoelium dendriticum]|nr:unnamed protein product [Dicrocoelium dendriticum]
MTGLVNCCTLLLVLGLQLNFIQSRRVPGGLEDILNSFGNWIQKSQTNAPTEKWLTTESTRQQTATDQSVGRAKKSRRKRRVKTTPVTTTVASSVTTHKFVPVEYGSQQDKHEQTTEGMEIYSTTGFADTTLISYDNSTDTDERTTDATEVVTHAAESSPSCEHTNSTVHDVGPGHFELLLRLCKVVSSQLRQSAYRLKQLVFGFGGERGMRVELTQLN